jgi:hypothetical protein
MRLRALDDDEDPGTMARQCRLVPGLTPVPFLVPSTAPAAAGGYLEHDEGPLSVLARGPS